MASDFDDVVSSKPKQSQKAPSEPPPKQTAGGSSQQPKQTSAKSTSQPYQAPAQPSGGSSGGKWLLGIAVVIGLIWLANQSDNSGPSKSAYSPETSSPSTAPANQPAIAQPQAPNRPSESKPSVGRNNVLSTAQIRYCLAEKIRLDASETVLNNYSDSEVDRFNAFVNDYNSRCGEFRYRQGSLESARRDVEPYRSQLQADGRGRFVRSPAATARAPASTPASKPAPPTPDSTVLAIQRRLNELGYNAGTPDGLFGNKTRSAIQTFQRDNGIAVDGVANSRLLNFLNTKDITSISAPTSGIVDPPAVRPSKSLSIQPEASRDVENFNKCIDGRYPLSCNHSLLTESEAARVDAAERKANFNKCIDGRYPLSCNHSLLTESEAASVGAAERKANFNKCIDGRYPLSCNHSLLTGSEAASVSAAERKANYNKCIDGRYPLSCNHSLLTESEAVRVGAAERKANFSKCIDGRYPMSCKHSLLTPDEAVRVAEAERRAIGLIWIANQSDNSRPSKSAYSPGTSSPSTAPANQPAIAQPQAPNRPSESKPSVGRNNVLSTAQIRYCLAEKIRLDASETVLNNYSDSEVDRFNAFVNDYNSRCGEFRYRQGSLESARRDVEPYRSQLQADGRGRFVRSPAATARAPASTPASKPAPPTPDSTVLAIQRRLNELGYNAGTPDGLFGNKTRSAIQAFQRDNGMATDGVASRSLLSQLNASTPRASEQFDGLNSLGGKAASEIGSAPNVVRRPEPSRDRENFATCISGEYPSLCKHSLLTREEAVQVEAAEKRANFSTCISGEYPSLCKHSWLTREEAAQVIIAERRANYRTCITGEYPSLCKHSLLTGEEAIEVQVAERRANFRTCISGDYPSLCKHSLLTPDEALKVAEAERRAKGR